MKLNKGQSDCVDDVDYWWYYTTKQEYGISGGPGTGKSTLIAFICKRLGFKRPLYIALTGSAVKELRKKGLEARTIHSTSFDYVRDYLRKDGQLVIREGYPVTTIQPIKKTVIEGDPDIIIVDECMMVNRYLADIIRSFGKRIIVLGDRDQLGPVGGDAGFFLNGPDFVLTEFMRQALDSPIVRFCKFINEGGILKPGMDFGKGLEIIKKKYIREQTLDLADINLTSSNRMRTKLNESYRKYKGLPIDRVLMGEKVICRRNSWSTQLHDGSPLTNGSMGYIKYPPNISDSNIKGGEIIFDFQPDYSDDYHYGLNVDLKHLLTSGRESDKYNYHLKKFEFAYSVTTTLAQGSEFDKVLFIYDWIISDDFMKRNIFTAASRARKILGIAV